MQKTLQYKNDKSGYVALLSTIIIGAVLLVMTIEAGQFGFYTRFMALGAEAKAQSRNLATGCGNQALAQVLTDTTWTGNATTTSSLGTCYIYPPQKNYPQSKQVTIKVRAVVHLRVTNLVLVYEMGDMYLPDIPQALPLPTPVSLGIFSPNLVSLTEVSVMP